MYFKKSAVLVFNVTPNAYKCILFLSKGWFLRIIKTIIKHPVLNVCWGKHFKIYFKRFSLPTQ